jgi:signal transduction histidine kinase
MVERDWLLQTLSDVFQRHAESSPEELSQNSSSRWRSAEQKAMAEWQGAVVALEHLLPTQVPPSEAGGLLLCGPTAIVNSPIFAPHFQTRIFSSEAFKFSALLPSRLPGSDLVPSVQDLWTSIEQLPLLPKDPIATERFCLVFTSEFALAILLGWDNQGIPAFYFSFAPELIEELWQTLRARLIISNYPQLSQLDEVVCQYQPPEPSYRLVTCFSHQLLKNLPEVILTEKKSILREVETIEVSDSVATKTPTRFYSTYESSPIANQEMELLQALTHEIRTPLTTIRTTIKLLLKRARNLAPDILKKLEMIDR